MSCVLSFAEAKMIRECAPSVEKLMLVLFSGRIERTNQNIFGAYRVFKLFKKENLQISAHHEQAWKNKDKRWGGAAG